MTIEEKYALIFHASGVVAGQRGSLDLGPLATAAREAMLAVLDEASSKGPPFQSWDDLRTRIEELGKEPVKAERS